MREFSFCYDTYQNLEQPDIYLGSADRTFISNGAIRVSNLNTELYFNNISSATFTVHYMVNGVINVDYDNVIEGNSVLIRNIGWFQITECNESGNGTNRSKDVTVLSFENHLSSRYYTSFGSMGVDTDDTGGLDLYYLHNPLDTNHSVLHIVLEKLPAWSIGYIDSRITTEPRTISEDSIDGYSLLTDVCSETFNCIFLFDTFELTINAYSIDSIGNLTDLYFSYNNVVREIKKDISIGDIKTVLYVQGGEYGSDNLGISEINPSGSNYIYNFDYFKPRMSSALRTKLDEYEKTYEEKKKIYQTYLISGENSLYSLYTKLSNLKNRIPTVKISELETKLIKLDSTISEETNRLQALDPYYGTKGGNVDLNHRPMIITSYTNKTYDVLGLTSYNTQAVFGGKYVLFTSISNEGIQYDSNTLKTLVTNYVNAGNSYKTYPLFLGEFNDSASMETYKKELQAYVKTVYDTIFGYQMDYYTILQDKLKLAQAEKDYVSSEWDLYGLVELEIQRDAQMKVLSLFINYQHDTIAKSFYDKTYETIYGTNGIEANITKRKAEISACEKKITEVKDILNKAVINLESFLGKSLYKELSHYVFEDTFSDTSFIATDKMSDEERLEMEEALLAEASKELAKVSRANPTFSLTASNLFAIKDFINTSTVLKLGDLSTIELNENETVEVRLLKITIDWSDMDFELTFSSNSSLEESQWQLKEIRDQASSASSSLNLSKYGWNYSRNTASLASDYMNSALDASKQALISSSNQDFVMDGTGLRGRRFNENTSSYDPRQIWITNGQIAFSNDSFKNVALALGKISLGGNQYYGLVADAIVGKLMISEALAIENSSGTFMVNTEGVSCTNLDLRVSDGKHMVQIGNYLDRDNEDENILFCIGKSTDGKKFTSKLMYLDVANEKLVMTGSFRAGEILSSSLNLCGGKLIINEVNGFNLNNKIKMTIDGGVTCKDIKAENLTITGSSTFSGALNGATGTFSGALSAASGSFSGSITGGSININNRFKVDSLGNVTLPDNAVISWGQVTGTGNVANKDDIPTKDEIADISKESVKVPTDGEIADISKNAVFDLIPTTEQITTITKNTITTSYISALNVVAGSVACENLTGLKITGKEIVGGSININNRFMVDSSGNVTLPSNATISWSQVTGTDGIAKKYEIPSTSDIERISMNAVQGIIPTEEQITTITEKTVTTTYVNALNITAAKVQSKSITSDMVATNFFTNVANGNGWTIIRKNASSYICGTLADSNNVVMKTGGSVAFACGLDNYDVGNSTVEANGKVRVYHDGRLYCSNVATVNSLKVSSSSATVNDNDVIHTGNYGSYCAKKDHTHTGYASSTHPHTSEDITSIPTINNNIRFSGSLNAASVDWVKANYKPLSSSDFRLKYDILELKNVEDFYLSLKPKSYKFKDGTTDNKTHYGLLAQEIQSNLKARGMEVDDSALVEAYDTRPYLEEGRYTGDTALRVNYEELHSFHIVMIQNMYKEIQELKSEIQELKSKINE